MRVVCISDTHLQHDQVKLPEGDLLIHTGDALGAGTIEELTAFGNWWREQPFKYKLYVPGNHDRIIYAMPRIGYEELDNLSTSRMLIDKEVIIEGYKFYGTPWTPVYKNWAFMKNYEQQIEIFGYIPKDTQILLSHGPVFGIRDYVPYNGTNAGSVPLRNKVLEIRPLYVIHGHIHAGYGREEVDGIKYINAAVCTERYEPVNKPIIFELK